MPRKALTFDPAGSGIRFPRINADQTTSELTAAETAVALGQPLVYPLANDVVFTNTATLGTVLTVPVEAGGRYHIEFHINIVASPDGVTNQGGFQMALTFPTLAQVDGNLIGSYSNSGTNQDNQPLADWLNTVGASGSGFSCGSFSANDLYGSYVLHLDVVATNAGDIVLQGAQYSAVPATSATFRKTSFATRLKLN